MMLAALERLADDADTAVIVLISKPPSPAVSQCVLERARTAGKPVVVNFLGGDPALIAAAGAMPAATLEDAAILAVQRAGGSPAGAGLATRDDAELVKAVVDRAARLAPGQRAIRGLYSGGTLAYEAALLLKDALPDADARGVHSLLDLGDDEYTVGPAAPDDRFPAAQRADRGERGATRQPPSSCSTWSSATAAIPIPPVSSSPCSRRRDNARPGPGAS